MNNGNCVERGRLYFATVPLCSTCSVHRWGKLQTDGGRRGFASVTSVSLGNRALSLFFLLSWTKLLGKSYSSSSIFISIALNLKRNSKHRSLSSFQFPLFHIFNRPGWRNAFLQLNRKRAIRSRQRIIKRRRAAGSDERRGAQAKWELTSARLTGLMDEGTRYLQGGGLLTAWLTLSTSFI